jgi:hypothetical protein
VCSECPSPELEQERLVSVRALSFCMCVDVCIRTQTHAYTHTYTHMCIHAYLQGIFELKQEHLTSADAFSCIFSRKEREMVRELKRTKGAESFPNFPPIIPCFAGLRDLLFSTCLWRSLRRIFYVAFMHATDAR